MQQKIIIETARQKFTGRWLPYIGQMALLAGFCFLASGAALPLAVPLLTLGLGAVLTTIKAKLFPWQKFFYPNAPKINPARLSVDGNSNVSDFIRAYPNFIEDIKDLSASANIAFPVVLLIEKESSIRAFSAGLLSPAIIAIGLERMETVTDYAELKSVIAHEITHIKKNDMLFFSAGQTVPLISTVISVACAAITSFSWPLMMAGIGISATSLIVHQAASRHMERVADKGSVLLAREPASLSKFLFRPSEYFSDAFKNRPAKYPKKAASSNDAFVQLSKYFKEQNNQKESFPKKLRAYFNEALQSHPKNFSRLQHINRVAYDNKIPNNSPY